MSTDVISRNEFQKELEYERQQKFKNIIAVVKELEPISYLNLCFQLAYRFGLKYKISSKLGVRQEEIDILVGVGKLEQKNDVITVNKELKKTSKFKQC